MTTCQDAICAKGAGLCCHECPDAAGCEDPWRCTEAEIYQGCQQEEANV